MINWIVKNRSWLLAIIVLAVVLNIFSGCASRSTKPTAVNKDGNFVSGFKEGYASIDPICEDHWFKRCPEDGSDPYWSGQKKPQPVIKDSVIPSTQDKETGEEEEGSNG